MLDIFIRTPTGSVKINESYFVLPVVAVESWDAVAVLSHAVHVSYLDICPKDCSWDPYKTRVCDCGNSFPWSSSKLSCVLLLELLCTENKNLSFQPASNVNSLTEAIREDSWVLNHPGPVLMTVPHCTSLRERARGCLSPTPTAWFPVV